MTEYWVSQAKHWCEYCRIFIGGSKQSIAFHENGKKHKEIVAMSLKDMRKRGRERRMEKDDMDKEMAKIERAAMKDFVAQDLAGFGHRRSPAAATAQQQGRAEHARNHGGARRARRAAKGLPLRATR